MRDGMHDWVEANNRMAKVLKAKGYDYQYLFCRNAGHSIGNAKRARQRTVAGSPEALGQIAKSGPSPSEIADLREQVARIKDCTESADLRVLQDRADGRDWKDLAAEHNTTPDALRKRIERVRQRIRDNLAK
jgi:hypothetical protein